MLNANLVDSSSHDATPVTAATVATLLHSHCHLLQDIRYSLPASTTAMSTTLYVLVTSAILLGAENGDISQAIDSALKIFEGHLLGYIIPLIAITILQWILQRLQPPLSKRQSKLEHRGDDGTRLVRLLACASCLSLSTIYAVDETSVEFQRGILCAAELIMEVRVFGWVVWSWRG